MELNDASDQELPVNDPTSRDPGRFEARSWLWLLLLLLGMSAWLWPIGLGGRMPVGGDVTQFSMGLMAVLDRALHARRLPLWNDLWGFGFPGLAESQMGVYYPPHLLLYGLFPTELAYTASLVIHTLWGAAGTFWAARRFGASPCGAALSGMAWSMSGFFVIHLPHQWGYTTGSWMPWAWGLGWLLVRGRGGPRISLALAGVLAIQTLPGHFQLAFCTEVGLLILLGWSLVERPEGGRQARWAAFGILSALLMVAPLAALQLWPTFQLARMAESHRTFDYLSDFAATPLHLVSYVAPGLFHFSPLWRPLAWDPFHSSPEEHLAYVGLVPLFLALGTITQGVRRDPVVRALTVVLIGTLILSLGPYFPGFSFWSRLPGFSFFRAPARWGLASMLALSLLAGLGFDRLRYWVRPGRMLIRYCLLVVVLVLIVLLSIELAFASTDGRGWPSVVDGFEAARRAMPWSGDPDFREVMREARRPPSNPIVITALMRRGREPATARLDRERFAIYASELGETGLVLLGLLLLSAFGTRPSIFRVGFFALTVIDLLWLGHHRDLETGPIRPLTEQSSVLGRLANQSRGTRTIDGLGNLPMVAGAAPVLAYRTLDLPALTALRQLAQSPIGEGLPETTIAQAMRATGAEIRVLGPFEATHPSADIWKAPETIDDPALAGWLFGSASVRKYGQAATRFTLLRPATPPSRAWLVTNPTDLAQIGQVNPDDTRSVLDILNRARSLVGRSPFPEQFDLDEIDVRSSPLPLVIIGNLYDPEWRGRWIGPFGEVAATVQPIFTNPQGGAWQAVRLPGPGPWILRLEYDGRIARTGLLISGPAWTIWLLILIRPKRHPGEPTKGAST